MSNWWSKNKYLQFFSWLRSVGKLDLYEAMLDTSLEYDDQERRLNADTDIKKLNKKFEDLVTSRVNGTRHPKCKGFTVPDIGWGAEYDCGYNTIIDCDECKYGGGRKDPEAKCNQDE